MLRPKIYERKILTKTNSDDNIRHRVVQVKSLRATRYLSSCNFIYRLPEKFKNVRYVKLLSGNIPATTEPYLYINMMPGTEHKVMSHDGATYQGILRYDLPAVNPLNLLDLDHTTFELMDNIHYLTEMNIQIYDKDNNLYSFGGDMFRILSVTAANPAVITTSANHGLAIGDIVYIQGFDNGSSPAVNNYINGTRWIVNTVPAANTLTLRTTAGVILNLAAEVSPSYQTGTGTTYFLGYDGEVILTNGLSLSISAMVAGVTGTRITTTSNHNLNINAEITIRGMLNGSTVSDNNLINGKHNVAAIVSPTQFEIMPILSAYPAVNPITGTNPPYTLGSTSRIFVDKYQCSFDIYLQLSPYPISYMK